MPTALDVSSEPGPSKAAVLYRLTLRPLRAEWDPRGHHVLRMARRAGFSELRDCRAVKLYFLKTWRTRQEIVAFAERALADGVTQRVELDAEPPRDWDHYVEVTHHPGVTDSEGASLLLTASKLGIDGVMGTGSGWRYLLRGSFQPDRLRQLAQELLFNPVVERASVDALVGSPLVEAVPARDEVAVVPIRDLAEEGLLALSRSLGLALDGPEMEAVRAYFREEGRDPTDAEIQMLAQTWSEHCVHKTFKAEIDYTGPRPGKRSGPVAQRIDGILASTIRAATEQVAREWVVSAFTDNAGVIRFHRNLNLAFKVETHNHPSALEPFGGANTGVGGVIRDVLGVSARPIANTDVLCFAPPDLAPSLLPAGSLPPERVLEGVVRGIEDYGNKMGIPTVNGAVVFHPGYGANPLVFCGCLGIVPDGAHPREPRAGDWIVVAGGRTGHDGLGGATFSSMEMDQTTASECATSVQIGDPIQEKLVGEATLAARDRKLYHAVTDCGAGGLSSAVGEMGAELGASVELELVPLKYPGLLPWEIWLSEAQERMVYAVAPDRWEDFRQLFGELGVEAIAIGRFEATGRLRLRYRGTFVADLSMSFLHEGIPRRRLAAAWTPPPLPSPTGDAPDTARAWLALVSDLNIRSRDSVIQRYDHEVQGGTTLRPGAAGDGAALVPLEVQGEDSPPAVVLSNGLSPDMGELDPYLMAWWALDEAVRNAVAAGADPDRIAVLDNFCWGNPALPDRLGALVRCAQGCFDAAVALRVPFISGKDSLNNEYRLPDGTRRAIPGTLLVSALGVAPSPGLLTGAGRGNLVYLLGKEQQGLAGSLYSRRFGRGGSLPEPARDALSLYRKLHQAMAAGCVAACHDLSEGGLAVAATEMCLAADLGMRLDDAPERESHFFGEAPGRLLALVEPAQAERFEQLLDGLARRVGEMHEEPILTVGEVFSIPLEELRAAWSGEALFSSLRGEESEQAAAPDSRSVSCPPGPALVGATRVAILQAPGTNREQDAAAACLRAGGRPEILALHRVLDGGARLEDFGMLVIPGGFSYGDDLGAGTLFGIDLSHGRIGEAMRSFIDSGRPVLGICNGFQALVRAGFLPGEDRRAALVANASGRFECRWVRLLANPASPCVFTQGLDEPIDCPVAHGEGRLIAGQAADLVREGLVALRYSGASYPANPNGSVEAIAGLCNRRGNVLGLMPHPENHVFPWQTPTERRGLSGGGDRLFCRGIEYAGGR
ncbi:MAG: phosphoribosylformylglycinamidine synthase I [Armatimonadetes bacterium]|nr:phosphoribosylformylglycinamidine synthase I [Armatimonadota bacterium]